MAGLAMASASRASVRAGAQSTAQTRAATPAPASLPTRSPVGAPTVRLAPASGEPMPAMVRAPIERSLGANLSDVRIHHTPSAAVAADSLSARAFAYGPHIVLGSRERPTDLALMAHEAAHVIQQRGAPMLQAKSSQQGSGALEAEADAAAYAALRGQPFTVTHRTGGATIQRQAQTQGSTWYGRAGAAITSAASHVIEFGESLGWKLLEEFAPELVPIVRQGPLEWFKEKISSAVEAGFNALMGPVRTLTGIAASLSGHFSHLIDWIREAATRISKGDCGAISEAAAKIQQVFEGLAAPIIDRIKHLVDRVKGFFNDIWDRFGAPVWQFLQRIGGQAWAKIQQLASWIWDKVAPIRRRIAAAWTWIKNKLGIGEGAEGQNGILQWVQRKAQGIWDEHIKPFYERHRRPILIIIGVLAMLSPAGPFIAIGAAIGGLAAGIRWIRQHFGTRDGIVSGRDMLRRSIIPGIMNAVRSVSTFLLEKTRFVADKLTSVVNGLNQAIGAVAGSILNFVVGILQWMLDRFQELADWATQSLVRLVDIVVNGLERLRVFLQPVLNVLNDIAQVIGDMMQLPMLLAGRLWNAIPACIRDPFVDFFIPLILRQIAFFRELAASPEAWRETRTQVMQLIRQIFRTHDLLGAMRTAFGIVVRAMRIPIDLLLQLLDKAASAWDAVLSAPLRFIETALKAILQGIGRFMRRILSHLWFGVQGWLLNAVSQSGTGVAPPTSWTAQAVFGFVLDVLGISVDHVIDLIDRRVPGAGRPLRTAVRILSGALEWLRIAIEEGPRGLWRHVVDRLSNLGTMVLEAAVGWVMTRVIANVSARLTALAASAGLSSVLEAVKAIYNAIQTAIEYMPRILAILIRAFDTVLQIAAGQTGPAAELLESGLRLAMPVVIGFLANYAGLSGISGRIREIIIDVRERVDNAILGLIDRAIAAIRSVLNAIRSGVKAVMNWWSERRHPRLADGMLHTLRFARSGTTARLMLASEEKSVQEHLQEAINGDELDQAEKDRARDALQFFNLHIAALTMQPISDNPPPDLQAKISALPTNLNTLSSKLATIYPGPALAMPSESEVRWQSTGPQRSSVELLSNRTSRRGEDARSGQPKGWDVIVRRGLTTSNGNWVRMHMITAGIGGKDVAGNLLPAPTAVNTGSIVRGFERQVEGILYGDTPSSEVRVARSLFKRLQTRTAVIWVETNAESFWPSFTDQASGQLLYDNSTFANLVSFKAGMYFPRNNAWVKDPAARLQAHVSVPQPNFTAIYQPNINEVGEPTIARLAGIDPYYAREIVVERGGTPASRPHTSSIVLATRMRQYRATRSVAVSDQFVAALNAVGIAIEQGKMKWRN